MCSIYSKRVIEINVESIVFVIVFYLDLFVFIVCVTILIKKKYIYIYIYIYNDNTEEVVTPSHLIYGRRLLSKPSNDKPDSFNVENLTRGMKYIH